MLFVTLPLHPQGLKREGQTIHRDYNKHIQVL